MSQDTDTATDTDTPPPEALERALRLAPNLLTPSPTNPRKRFDPARVQAIADSMRSVGQISPIRARPNPVHRANDGRAPWEIVVGETRWHAAKLAQLPAMDVIVRDYTDTEVLEVQLVENLQRSDLHPMEEAEGYGQLLRSPTGLQGHATVADLAARLGKSESYVYQRMKLLALCAAGRDAFYAGHVSPSVALLIARMPNAEEQARATARIVAGFGGEPYSYRQAAEYLQKEFMLRLSLARFDTSATYAVAGPCGNCPKRSGAAPDLFADVATTAGDMCQDARCYQAKAEEAHQALLQAARDAGRTVLQGSAARKVLPTPDGRPVGYYRLDAPCPALTDSHRPLRELLGRGSTAHIVVVDLPDTTPVELVDEAAARKALKARSLLREQAPAPAAAPQAAVTRPAPTPDRQRPTSAPPAPSAPAAVAAPTPASTPPTGGEGGGNGGKAAGLPVVDDGPALARQFGCLLMAELAEKLRGLDELPVRLIVLVIQELFDQASAEDAALLYTTLGWQLDENGEGLSYSRDFWPRLRGMTGRELGELLGLVLAVSNCTDENLQPDAMWRYPAGALASHLGIDLVRVRRNAQISLSARLAMEVGSVAGPARQRLDMTAVFVSQHGPAAGGADTAPQGQADEQTDEGASDDHQ